MRSDAPILVGEGFVPSRSPAGDERATGKRRIESNRVVPNTSTRACGRAGGHKTLPYESCRTPYALLLIPVF